MNGISQNGEPWWAQNDPQSCLQGDLNPDQWILTKQEQQQQQSNPKDLGSKFPRSKSNGKDEF